MSKLTKDHPAFQRMEAFIQRQVEACRPSAQKLAVGFVLARGFNLSDDNFFIKVGEHVDHLENKMTKKLRRYYGLNGKYVAH